MAVIAVVVLSGRRHIQGPEFCEYGGILPLLRTRCATYEYAAYDSRKNRWHTSLAYMDVET